MEQLHVTLARHTMLEFVLTLPGRLKKINIIDPSEFEVPGEKCEHLGEASEQIRQLLSLVHEMNQRIAFLQEALRTSCMPSEETNLRINLQKARDQVGIVEYMLDLSLVETHPRAYDDGKHCAFIGPGWQIYKVTMESLVLAETGECDDGRHELNLDIQ